MLIWAELFGTTPERLADHWEGCLRCVHDVRGQPSRREYEKAARALSACQTKFCMSNLPPPIRCMERVEESHERGIRRRSTEGTTQVSEKRLILAYLRRWLVEHHAGGPPPTGGIPSPSHTAHWAKQDMLKQVIEDIEQEKHKVMRYDFTEPPDSKARFTFSADKWDDNFARNACLYFIQEKGLDEEFMAWLLENSPEGWIREE